MKFNENMIVYLKNHFTKEFKFWTEGKYSPDSSIESLCDMAYCLYLLDHEKIIDHSASKKFSEILREQNFPGWEFDKSNTLSIHNLAYAFGTLNLLPNKELLYDRALFNRVPDFGSIIDQNTKRPVFPRKWAHHSWRVSHWLGGVPSILLSVSNSGHPVAEDYINLSRTVREATDSLINPETGLIKAYNSDLIQLMFRFFYSARHDPDLGDLGGIAHILWIDHALDRRYVALEKLYESSRRKFLERTPFMEKVPYCLDFDIVQIVRTSGAQLSVTDTQSIDRAFSMMKDIESFFAGRIPDTFTLHKAPGALATWHECGIIINGPSSNHKDIIRQCYWL
ncbi:hypothetical protein ACVNHC_01890 [Pannonibacter sp. Q-1]